MTEDLYAFWRYDQFPYLIGDAIKERVYRKEHGWSVTPVSYGGARFREWANLPAADGKILSDALNTLMRERAFALEEVKKAYDLKLWDLLQDYGLPPPRDPSLSPS